MSQKQVYTIQNTIRLQMITLIHSKLSDIHRDVFREPSEKTQKTQCRTTPNEIF